MFKRFRYFNLYVNLEKYEFFIIKVEFLSFIMFINNVLINKRRTKAI